MTVKQLPNFISCLRILGTMILLFLEPLTIGFYGLYTFCGLTDILDGYIARKCDAVSELGSKLDSAADILYYAMMIFKILPILIKILPIYIWYVFFGVIAVRILSYIIAAIKYRCFASRHTYMNKASGFCAFLTPYFVEQSIAAEYCTFLGVIVSAATLEELLMHILCKKYGQNVKSIFGKEMRHCM